jgi:hypothetical protein
MRQLSFLVLLFFTALISCKKSDSPFDSKENQSKDLVDPAQTSPVYKKLREIGFSAADIKDVGNYYLVDGDLLFKKEGTDPSKIQHYFEQALINAGEKRNAPRTEQWIASDIVSAEKVEAIKINISPFDVANASSPELADWMRTAITAASDWASISNCRINFTDQYYYQDPNGISIVDDGGTLPNGVIAAAEFPSNGNVGWRIQINLDFNGNMTVSSSSMRYNLVHEMGHTLGFFHSNWQTNDSPNGQQHNLVPGTPSTDANSVMNGGTALFSWNGFSTNDAIAAQTVFPQGTYYNWLTSPGGSNKYTYLYYYYISDVTTPVTITWNSSLVSTSTVTLQVYYDGALVQTIASGIPNNGSYSYPLAQAGYHTIPGGAFMTGLRVKIIADNNPSISDLTPVFYLSNNEQ